VSYAELRANIHPDETQVTIPRNIERRLNENTTQVLQTWLNSFGTAKEKNDFLKNLSQVIAEAERATLWKNGVPQTLSDTQSSAESVFVR